MKKRAVAVATAFALLASVAGTGTAVSATKPAAKQAADTPCDRACLIALTDTYVAAVVAHDPSKVQLASDIRFVENVKRMKPGEGLWKSATAGPTTFKIYVPDAVAQQVGFIGAMQSDGKPVEVAVRLKLVGGKITEAEHIFAEVREANLPHMKSPRLPLITPVTDPDYRDARGRLLHIAATYYDALDNNNGSLAPFADDCVRFENGMQTVRNVVPSDPSQGLGLASALGCTKQLDTNSFEYIDRIENRRVWIADEENGVAIGFSHFRHPMTKTEFKIYGIPGQKTRDMKNQKPFDMPAAHIFKIWGGQIHEIEAVGVSAPYNSPTGWEE
ncbi:MAG: hypothetical protein WDO56_17975 [Gammaproteobacteria bacterium]